jgi:AcrR family transcriptional regulator
MPEKVAYERGPYAKGIERREAILAATLEVFSQSGYRKTSLRAIARELHITPTLIQHYFTSRDDLLTAVIKAWDAENGRLNEGLSMIDAFLHGIRHNMSIPGLVRLYTAYSVEASDPDHPARPYFEQRYQNLTTEMAKDIRRLQDLGDVAESGVPERLARTLIAACEGLQVRWLLNPDFDMYEEFTFVLEELSIPVPGREAGPRKPERKTQPPSASQT